jgi:hypothetical protein
MEFRHAQRAAEAARAAIRSSRTRGIKQLKSQVRSYLRNTGVKFEAVYRTLGIGTPECDAADVAAQINLFAPDVSPITFWRRPKRDGVGFRLICRLAPEGRVRHLIIKEALEAAFLPGDHLYLLKGRGRDREAVEIQRALAEGCVFGWRADIRSAFDSVRLDACGNTLPLPASVIRANLLHELRIFRHQPEKEHEHRDRLPHIAIGLSPQPEEPTGLMQGAASSSIIFAWLMNDMANALQSDVRLFVYGDNVLVLSSNRAECAAVARTLALYALGSRLNAASMRREQRGKGRPDNFWRACHSVLRCA